MSGIQERDLPEGLGVRAAVAIGIEGVDAIVLGDDEEDVVRALAGDAEIGHVKRLSVDVAIHGVAEQLSELGGVDVGERQRRFVAVQGVAGVVVAGSDDADLRGELRREQADEHGENCYERKPGRA